MLTSITLLAAGIALIASFPVQAEVALVALPGPQYIEEGQGRRFLNFDVLATNKGPRAVDLTEVKLTVYDAAGRPALERLIGNNNGINISLDVTAFGTLDAGVATTYFNPFHDFPADMPLDRLEYRFTFREKGEGGGTLVSTLNVQPKTYRGQARLRLPLNGTLLSYDAHDFYSHHRRADPTAPSLKRAGITSNAARYSYDLSTVDAAGRQYRGDGRRNSDWYSWEQPVLAPAGGRIVALANDRPDQDIAKPNFRFTGPPYDPTLIDGNYVVIDHGHGEFSLLAHMRQGSIRHRIGDQVRPGEMVGRVGFSGAVITIHLHYQLQNGITYNSEGLPSAFNDFDRVRGARTIRVVRGTVDTGEFVRSRQ